MNVFGAKGEHHHACTADLTAACQHHPKSCDVYMDASGRYSLLATLNVLLSDLRKVSGITKCAVLTARL